MTMISSLVSGSWRGSLPIAINACLAALLGAYLASWLGAIIGFAIALALPMTLRIVPEISRNFVVPGVARIATTAKAIWNFIRPGLGLLLLPIVLPLTTIAALGIYVAQLVTRPIRSPAKVFREQISLIVERLYSFCAAFFIGPALPLTLANIVAVVIIFGVLAQIEFASYVVFAAVPMMIMMLIGASFEEGQGVSKKPISH
jgi:hypothetical protein